jgi:hypothetical protein
MSVSTVPELAGIPHAADAPSNGRTGVNIQDEVVIPSWIVDLDTYRQWAHSDQYPERGWISYLDGEIWVDLSREELITHNKVKTAFAFAIMSVLKRIDLGEFLGDRVFLTNAQANLATEPDSMAYLWSTIQSGKLVPKPGKSHGYIGIGQRMAHRNGRWEPMIHRNEY